MGASNSRFEDAALLLAVPKFTAIGKRRLLDPSCRKCSVCGRGFGFMRKKHYCRRCGGIVCDDCTSMRHYKQRTGHGFRVCTDCNMLPIVHVVPQKVWHLILSFCGNVAHHNMLQVCRKAQLSVPLPHQWGDTWDAFFTDGQFISKGANGSVYKSTLRNDPRRTPVAVKVIQKNTIFSLRKWHHIQREIDALTTCKHPHVIELIRVAQSPEAVFIVLQYAQGGDLFDWLMSRKAPSEAEVKPIAQQLLSTLHFMHEVCGAVHRDIKPENILLEKRVRGSETPTIRLADFGFARVFPQLTKTGPVPLTAPRHNPANDITVAATPCGTLGFAAPEIIVAYSNRKEHMKEEEELQKKGGPISTPTKKVPASPDTPVELMKKMDIFAAGVTLCILLTGCEPFPCHSSKAHLEAVNEGASFDGKQWSHVSHEARDLLRRMLHPAASKRPTSLECLQSKWLTAGLRQPLVLSARAEDDAELVKSFQQSIRSLKKNDGMMLVHDRTGTIQRRNRQEVLEDTLLDEPPVAPPGPQFSRVPPAQSVPIPQKQQAVLSPHTQSVNAEEQHVGSLDVFIE